MSTIKSSAENLTLNADGANNDVIIQSNGSTKVTVDGATGAVGIGRTPSISSSKLEVGGADDVSLINVEASGATGGIGIGGTGLQFYHGSTARMKISSAGDTTIASGNLVIGTAGKGIDFSATSGTGTSEVLDDYEEGYTDMGGVAGVVFDSLYDKLKYVKIGKQVTITGLIQITSATGGVNFQINLPFVTGGTVSDAHGAAANQVMSHNIPTGDAGLAIYVRQGSSTASFYKINNNASWIQLSTSELAASDAVYFSISYFTA